MVTSARNRKLLLLYYRYKDSPYYIGSIALLIGLVSFVLIFNVIIPQVQDLFSINNEITATRERITNLKRNIAYLNSLNTATLDSDLQLTFSALPSEKDFASIINAVNRSAIDSGVLLNDYTLIIGELATPSAKLKKFASVDLSITIEGTKEDSKNFIKRIYEIIPLSQISTLSLTEEDTSLRISFYVKQFPSGSYNVVEQIKQIPPNDAALFNKLSAWRIDDSQNNNNTVLEPELDTIGLPF